eukprot:1300475-Amphidinium_carterae.1
MWVACASKACSDRLSRGDASLISWQQSLQQLQRRPERSQPSACPLAAKRKAFVSALLKEQQRFHQLFIRARKHGE